MLDKIVSALYQILASWWGQAPTTCEVANIGEYASSLLIKSNSLVTSDVFAKSHEISSFVGTHSLDNAIAFLSTLPDLSMFSVSDEDIPIMQDVDETMPSSQIISADIISYMPVIAFASTHPWFSVAWLFSQYISLSHARSLQETAHCQPGAAASNQTFAFIFNVYEGSSVADLAVAPNGDILIAGTTRDIFNDRQDKALLVRFNEAGYLLWAKSVGATAKASRLAITQAGEIIWLDHFGHRVVKFNEMGEQQWATSIASPNPGFNSRKIKDLVLTPEGETVLTGFEYGNSWDPNLFLVKLNTAGEIRWAKKWDRENSNIFLYSNSLAIDANGNILLIGYSDNFMVPRTRIFLMQFNREGDFLWAKLLGNQGDRGHSIVLANNGDIFLAGNRKSEVIFTKLTSSGELQWASTLQFPDYTRTDTDINLMLVEGEHIIVSGSLDSRVFLLSFNTTGELQWSRYLRLGNSTSDTFGTFSHLKGTLISRNNILLARDTDMFDGGIFLARLNAQGILDTPHVSDIIDNNDNAVSKRVSLGVLPVFPSMIPLILFNYSIGMLPSSSDINSTIVHPLTLRMKINNAFFNVPLYYQVKYFFTVDNLFADFYLPMQMQLAVDVGQAQWLQYRTLDGLLQGTPLPSAQANYSIVLDVYVGGDIRRSEIRWVFPMRFCVQPYDYNVPSFFRYSVNPRQIATFGQRYQFDFATLLYPNVSVLYITGGEGLPFPHWLLSYNGSSGQLIGRPYGSVRGDYLAQITFFAGIELPQVLSFIFSVPNTLPFLVNTLNDVTMTEGAQLSYRLEDSFIDPDGDLLTYQAIAPEFLSFDSSTKTLFGFPPIGNHQVHFIARDSFNGSANVSMQIIVVNADNRSSNNASSKSKTTWGKENYIILFATVGGALVLTASGLIFRQMRIHSTTKKLKELAKYCHSDVTDSSFVTFEALLTHLTVMRNKIVSGMSSDIDTDMSHFEKMVISYYHHTEQALVITRLFSVDIVPRIVDFMSEHLLELTVGERNSHELLRRAQLLNRLFRLLLIEHGARDRKIPSEMKWGFCDVIDKLLVRLPRKTINDIRVLHELLSARECLVCLPDSDTLGILLMNCVRHLISINLLIKDLKILTIEIPARWCCLLLETWEWVESAKTNIDALNELQKGALKNGDWRFRFGLVQVLLTVLLGSNSPTVREQVICGKQSTSKITHLGLVHLLQGKGTFWNKSRVTQEAVHRLREKADRLNGAELALLSKHMVFRTEKIPSPRFANAVSPLDQESPQSNAEYAQARSVYAV